MKYDREDIKGINPSYHARMVVEILSKLKFSHIYYGVYVTKKKFSLKSGAKNVFRHSFHDTYDLEDIKLEDNSTRLILLDKYPSQCAKIINDLYNELPEDNNIGIVIDNIEFIFESSDERNRFTFHGSISCTHGEIE